MPAFGLGQYRELPQRACLDAQWFDADDLHSCQYGIVVSPRGSHHRGVSNAGFSMYRSEQPRDPAEFNLDVLDAKVFDTTLDGFGCIERDLVAEEGGLQGMHRAPIRAGFRQRRAAAPPPPVIAPPAPSTLPSTILDIRSVSRDSAIERFAQRTCQMEPTIRDAGSLVTESGNHAQVTSNTLITSVSDLRRQSGRQSRYAPSKGLKSHSGSDSRLGTSQTFHQESPTLKQRRASVSSMFSSERQSVASSRLREGETSKSSITLLTKSAHDMNGMPSFWTIMQSRKNILHYRTERLVRSYCFSALFAFLSLYALYGDDIRLSFFEKQDDYIFNWITGISLALFTTEMTLGCLVLKDYPLSFFFFLDFVSTVSLILDLTFVWDALLGQETFSIEASSATTEDNALAQSEYARAGRSSRVGTRLVRILRVVRLVRMTRLFKFCLFRGNQQRVDNKARLLLPGGVASFDEKERGQQESLVGQKLSERTTLRVIVLVLCMLIMVPMLDVGDHGLMSTTSAQYGVDVINQAWYDFIWNEKQGSSASVLKETRLTWEEELLTYIFYHNHQYARCPDNLALGADCASDYFFKLCFFGFVARHDAVNGTSSLTARHIRLSTLTWETISSTTVEVPDMRYVVGEFPEHIKDRFLKQWRNDCGETNYDMYGVSLWQDEPCPWKSRRVQEITWFWPIRVSSTSIQDGRMVFFFDVREDISWRAFMSMCQTTFVILVLAIGALVFSKDADKLVLLPIETMINKVDIIRQDPLYATTMGDDVYRRKMKVGKSPSKKMTLMKSGLSAVRRASVAFSSGEESSASGASNSADQSKQKTRSWKPSQMTKKRKKLPGKVELMETKILENTIIKLGSLLALGFGEAGTVMIGKNLDATQATVDVLIPGRRVRAIYGNCRISNFTATTEVLGEKTVVFVNRIAKIVHSTIDAHLGSANKNMGEAFLLVWRLDHHHASLQTKLSDLSVLSFVQIIIAINRDMELAGYRDHPGLLARLHNYRVTLRFGLHIGNSIEGPIGSQFKIDASYVSTHVTLASQLESIASSYAAMILLTEALARSCSEGVQRYFRAIDRILMEAAKDPMRIFTFDVDCDALFVNVAKIGLRTESNKYAARLQRQDAKSAKLESSYQPLDVFLTDKHIQRMRAIYSLEFFQSFEKGYLNYEAGEWIVAGQVLAEASIALKNRAWHYDAIDGPSSALIEYMSSFDFVAPPSWSGFRKFADISHHQLGGRISKN